MEYSNNTELGKRINIIEQSPEMEIHRNLQALQASFRVFDGNYNELIQYIEHLRDTKTSLTMYAQDKRVNVETLIYETSRLLHNFLASAKSLVDHTRRIVNRLYQNHEFIKEYQKILQKDVLSDPLQKFVQNLRNYTLHYTLPIPALHISFSNNLSFSMQIDVEVLKQWDNWNSSKSYLETLEKSLPILDLVNTYFTLIQNFYTWLTARQHNIHQADLEKLDKMQKELMI